MKKVQLTLFGEDLIVVNKSLQKFDDDAFDKTTSSGKFLPRVQLMTSNTKKCKDGKFPINHYALVDGSSYIDIGTEVDMIVIAWRPKALDTGNQIIAVYDPEHSEFQRIQDEADEKDSNCMFGPEYLVYVPEREKFATFFFGNKSARKEAANMKSQMHKGATAKSAHLSNKNHDWWSILIVACSSPMGAPEQEDILAQLENFNNPPDTEIEKVTDGDESSRAR